MRRNCVAYYRTSSKTNVGEDKDSQKRQQVACHSFAKPNNLKIVAEFYDADVKGKDPIGTRKGYSELMEYCQRPLGSIAVHHE